MRPGELRKFTVIKHVKKRDSKILMIKASLMCIVLKACIDSNEFQISILHCLEKKEKKINKPNNQSIKRRKTNIQVRKKRKKKSKDVGKKR